MAFKDRSKKMADEKLVDEFVSKADKTSDELDALNPKATRKKQLGIKVNEHEFQQLEALAEQLDRSITATIRYALNKTIREELIKD